MDLFQDIFLIAILLSPLGIKVAMQWFEARKSGWNRLGAYYGGQYEPTGKSCRLDGIRRIGCPNLQARKA
jgi:hypothetical protein